VGDDETNLVLRFTPISARYVTISPVLTGPSNNTKKCMNVGVLI
jgi:hypothetical protein